MMGMTNCITIVTFHHLWLAFMQSNIELITLVTFIGSYAWVWFIPALEDINPKSPYY